MAILIGVIALAVIPNIQRSRESKDLTTLDNIMSAMNVAAANAQMKKSEKATVKYDGTSGALAVTCPSSDTKKAFEKHYKDAIGDGTQKLGSGVGTGLDIEGEVVMDANAVAKITVRAKGSPTCKYTTDDKGNDAKLEVTNGAAS